MSNDERDHTELSEATKDEDRRSEEVPSGAGRMPTPDEDAAAEAAYDQMDERGETETVRRHYREMTERGAHQEGEGKI